MEWQRPTRPWARGYTGPATRLNGTRTTIKLHGEILEHVISVQFITMHVMQQFGVILWFAFRPCLSGCVDVSAGPDE
jgi:hypothetical protein